MEINQHTAVLNSRDVKQVKLSLIKSYIKSVSSTVKNEDVERHQCRFVQSAHRKAS